MTNRLFTTTIAALNRTLLNKHLQTIQAAFPDTYFHRMTIDHDYGHDGLYDFLTVPHFHSIRNTFKASIGVTKMIDVYDLTDRKPSMVVIVDNQYDVFKVSAALSCSLLQDIYDVSAKYDIFTAQEMATIQEYVRTIEEYIKLPHSDMINMADDLETIRTGLLFFTGIVKETKLSRCSKDPKCAYAIIMQNYLTEGTFEVSTLPDKDRVYGLVMAFNEIETQLRDSIGALERLVVGIRMIDEIVNGSN